MAGNPLIDVLDSNIKKFKSSSEHINKKFNDLIPEEKDAFHKLKEWWQTNDFNAQKCEYLLKKLALGKNKHPADMELLENLQEFRTICKSYYTKDKDVFERFQNELGGKIISAPEPPQPQYQQEKSVNPLIEMLAFNVKKWNETIDFLYKKYDLLISEEKQALAELDEYWNEYDFNAAKCEKLLERMAIGKKKHPADLDLLEALQDFRRLCRDYYTKDKEFFIAFQEAMGGKGSKKPKPKPKPKPQPQQQQQPKPQPQPIPTPQPEKPTGIGAIGSFIWKNLNHVPWIITVIIFTIAFIFDGISWLLVLIIILGGLGSALLYILIEFIKSMLESLWNEHKYVYFIILAVIIARILYKMGVFSQF